MKRESFPFMTMRQIVTGLDVSRQPHRHRTSSEAFSRVDHKELLPHVDEKAIAVELEEERRKFVRQNQALARSRQKLLATRARLFATKVKNERLMELRHKLQRQRWQDTEVAAPQTVRAPLPVPSIARHAGRRSLREIRVRRG